MIHSFSKLPTC